MIASLPKARRRAIKRRTAAYLDAVLKDGDAAELWVALERMAQAFGDKSQVGLPEQGTWT